MRKQIRGLTFGLALFCAAFPLAAGGQTPSTPQSIAEAAKRLKQPLILMQVADGLGMWRGAPGRETLDEIRRVEFEATGAVFEPAATGPWTERKLKKVVFGADYSIPASRVLTIQTDAAGKDTQQIGVFKGDIAWNETAPGVGATPAPGAAYMRKRELEVLPHAFMHAVFEADPKMVKISKQGGKMIVAAPIDGVIGRMTVGANLRPERIELPIEHPVLGKTTLIATYDGYKDWEGYEVFFPSKINYALQGKTWIDLTVTHHSVGVYLIFPTPANMPKVAEK